LHNFYNCTFTYTFTHTFECQISDFYLTTGHCQILFDPFAMKKLCNVTKFREKVWNKNFLYFRSNQDQTKIGQWATTGHCQILFHPIAMNFFCDVTKISEKVLNKNFLYFRSNQDLTMGYNGPLSDLVSPDCNENLLWRHQINIIILTSKRSICPIKPRSDNGLKNIRHFEKPVADLIRPVCNVIFLWRHKIHFNYSILIKLLCFM